MRRCFFRLMLGDLNSILDGLTELEDKGVETIDCRRAQFSAQEPIIRLRMICQSWKVMFQAEYSSGSPLRMLVDLKASVEQALGRGKAAEPEAKLKAATAKPSLRAAGSPKDASVAAAAAAGASKSSSYDAVSTVSGHTSKADPVHTSSEAAEFEVSGTPAWDPDSASESDKKN